MTEKKKIGIEQYIPFELINATILEYLETKDINKDELFQRMLEYNKGENRAKKASNSIYSAITKTSFINKALLKNLTTESYNRLSTICNDIDVPVPNNWSHKNCIRAVSVV